MKTIIKTLRSLFNREQRDLVHKLRKENALLFEQSPSMMLIIDSNGVIEDANQQSLSFAGMSKDDIVGLRCGEFFNCLIAMTTAGGCGCGENCQYCMIRNAVLNAALYGQETREGHARLVAMKEEQQVSYDVIFSTYIINEDDERRVLMIMNDVTQIVKTEKALESSELRYKALIDHVDEAILIYDETYHILGANIRARALFGYSVEAIRAMGIKDLINDDVIDKALEQEKPLHITKTITSSKGVVVIGDLSLSPVIIDDRKYVYLNIKDITRTVVIQEDLLKSKMQMESIFNHTPSLLCLMSRDGTISKINKSRREEKYIIGGIDRHNNYDAIIDCLRTVKASLTGDSDEYCQHCTLKREIVEALNENVSVYRKEGTLLSHRGIHDRIFVVFSIIQITDASEEQLLIAVEDVTEHRKARKEILAREVKYRTLFESSRDGICLLDLAGNYLDANNAFLSIVGYNLKTLKTMNYRDITPVEWVEIEEKYVDDELMSQGYISTYEKQYIHKAGTMVDVEISAFSMNDENLRQPIICAIVRDMSEKKVLIKQIQESQKMQAIGLLAGGIAHDFNNILAGIIGYTELASMEGTSSDKIKDYLLHVLRAGERARKLVKQILTFSRHGGGEKSVIRLGRIVDEVIELVEASTPSSINLVVNIIDDAPVFADPTNIHEAVMNLATNAIYATGIKGEVVITLEAVTVDVAQRGVIGTIYSGDYVTVKVDDNGSGIEVDKLKTIFDPFYTTKQDGDGTGLGLSVVYGIMQGHDGDITVVSEEGYGTTITLYFPMSRGQAELEATYDVPQVSGSLKILFLDDEALLVELASEMFRKLGHKVVVTESARDVLEILKNNEADFDLLVTDYAMPLMNGIELIESLREMGIEVPAIICSGNVDVIDGSRAKALNIVEILPKPIKISEFDSILSRMTAFKSVYGGAYGNQ